MNLPTSTVMYIHAVNQHIFVGDSKEFPKAIITAVCPSCHRHQIRKNLSQKQFFYFFPAARKPCLNRGLKRSLQRGQPTPLFDELVAAGRTALTLEALAVQSRFAELFTDAEADECFARLIDAGYYRM